MCVLCMNVNWKTVNNKTPKVPMDQQSNLWISQGQVHCVDMYAQLQTMTYVQLKDHDSIVLMQTKASWRCSLASAR